MFPPPFVHLFIIFFFLQALIVKLAKTPKHSKHPKRPYLLPPLSLPSPFYFTLFPSKLPDFPLSSRSQTCIGVPPLPLFFFLLLFFYHNFFIPPPLSLHPIRYSTIPLFFQDSHSPLYQVTCSVQIVGIRSYFDLPTFHTLPEVWFFLVHPPAKNPFNASAIRESLPRRISSIP
jgi:hypothetical protein